MQFRIHEVQWVHNKGTNLLTLKDICSPGQISVSVYSSGTFESVKTLVSMVVWVCVISISWSGIPLPYRMCVRIVKGTEVHEKETPGSQKHGSKGLRGKKGGE